jgi:hypothetical protein
MNFARRRFEVAAAAAMALCGLSAAAQATLTPINLSTVNVLPGGAVTSSTPLGLNNYDQVVGYYSTATGQQSFVYTPGAGVSTLPSGAAGYNNEARGINDSGLVVGTYGGNGTTESFYYNTSAGASSFTQILPVADASSSTSYTGAFIQAQAINKNNVVTGYGSVSNTSTPSSNRTFAYTIPGGTATDVSTSYSGTAIGQYGSNSTFGYAINSSGVIASYGPTPNSANSTTPDPFILTPKSGGGYTGTDLAAKILVADPNYGKAASTFEGIDDAGNVVGNYYEQSPPTTYGFFYNTSSQSVVEITNSLGTGSVKIYGISDVGSALIPEFVGSAVISGGTTHAFLDYGGTMYDLNTIDPVAGYTLNAAYAINGSGDIIATATPTAGGSAQAFLLSSSVPEPTSLGLLGIAAMALLGRRRGGRIA